MHAFEFPVDEPNGREQNGVMTWPSTTIVLAEACGSGQVGLRYTCGDVSVAALVAGRDALAPAAACGRCSAPARCRSSRR